MSKKEYKIIARNLRLKMGEIDILCHDPATDSIILVEVKARTHKSDATPNPESSITAARNANSAPWLERSCNAMTARANASGLMW